MPPGLLPLLPMVFVAGIGVVALTVGSTGRGVGAAVGYVLLFVAVWLIGSPSADGPPLLGIFGVLALLWILVGVIAKSGDSRRLVWIGVALTLSLSVAMASGPEGGPGRLARFLTEVIGLDATQADTVNLVIRKTVHVAFYGLIAWTFARALPLDAGCPRRTAFATAAIWTLGHAAFDELNQLLTPGRTGQIADFLLDALGVAVALVWLAVCVRRDTPADP